MKKTKIVCTLGPASDTKEIISAMAEAGMNVVRLNFSHGTHADHAIKIKTVKEVRTEKKIPHRAGQARGCSAGHQRPRI